MPQEIGSMERASCKEYMTFHWLHVTHRRCNKITVYEQCMQPLKHYIFFQATDPFSCGKYFLDFYNVAKY